MIKVSHGLSLLCFISAAALIPIKAEDRVAGFGLTIEIVFDKAEDADDARVHSYTVSVADHSTTVRDKMPKGSRQASLYAWLPAKYAAGLPIRITNESGKFFFCTKDKTPVQPVSASASCRPHPAYLVSLEAGPRHLVKGVTFDFQRCYHTEAGAEHHPFVEAGKYYSKPVEGLAAGHVELVLDVGNAPARFLFPFQPRQMPATTIYDIPKLMDKYVRARGETQTTFELRKAGLLEELNSAGGATTLTVERAAQ